MLEKARWIPQHRKPRIIDTFRGSVTDILGSREVGDGLARPQAFMVEQEANWVTPAHFHLQDQFQVVTAGGGAIGKHAVAPLAVHFAGADTGYGPITAGPAGVSYLTLRAAHDTGASYLHKPGSREKMRPALAKQQAYGAPIAAIGPVRTIEREVLIAPKENGLAAHRVRLPAGAALDAIDAAAAHGGCYYIVTGGGVQADGASLDALAVLFASAGESPAIRAGDAGADVLVLAFPRDVYARPAGA